MRLAALVLAATAGASLTGCALFQRPALDCKFCWREVEVAASGLGLPAGVRPPPCPPDWIQVAEEDGGGCVIVVAAGVDCPEE